MGIRYLKGTANQQDLASVLNGLDVILRTKSTYTLETALDGNYTLVTKRELSYLNALLKYQEYDYLTYYLHRLKQRVQRRATSPGYRH